MGITKAGNVWRRASILSGLGSGAVMLFLMLWVVADVTGRYVFLQPIPGGVESVELMLPWIAFLAVSYTLIQGSHVRVSLVVHRLPSQLQWWADSLGHVVGVVLFGLLAYCSWLQFYESVVIMEYMEAMVKLPWWAGKMGMPIGLFVMFVLCFLLLLMKFTRQIGAIAPDKGRGEY